MNTFDKSEMSMLAARSQIVGTLTVHDEFHLYGKILGELKGSPGSKIILKQGSLVEGKIFADSIIIEGFVKGDVIAETSLWITPHGKVVGTVKTSSLQIDPGAVFEASIHMTNY